MVDPRTLEVARVALEIAKKEEAQLMEIREALERGNEVEALRLLRIFVGLTESDVRSDRTRRQR